MDIEKHLPFLKQLARGLAIQFGPKCEVVIHKLTDGPENTIVVIENGHVTGRQVGDGASRIVMQALQAPDTLEDNLGYLTRTPDGRLLRSSSICLKNENGQPMALICINFDFTELSLAGSILMNFAPIQNDVQCDRNRIQTIYSNVHDMVDHLIEESAVFVGKPVALMDRDDKVKAIKYLDEKGALSVKKSGDKISQFFGISKYTLYSYLNINGKEEEQD